jgi:hypothetical protein
MTRRDRSEVTTDADRTVRFADVETACLHAIAEGVEAAAHWSSYAFEPSEGYAAAVAALTAIEALSSSSVLRSARSQALVECEREAIGADGVRERFSQWRATSRRDPCRGAV